MKQVLMVAFHFPPLAGSSGIQRTLRFAAHLPSFGWQPTVLTAHPRAYERTSQDLMSEVGPDVAVERAFALDTVAICRRAADIHGGLLRLIAGRRGAWERRFAGAG